MKVNARSLLVVNRHIRLGLHYDSLSQRNYEVAKKTLDKISHLMNEGFKFLNIPETNCKNSDSSRNLARNKRINQTAASTFYTILAFWFNG